MPDNETLITLTADIVAAHVSNNNVAISDVPTLVQRIHGALAALTQPSGEPAPPAKEPKVSIRASIKPDFLTCLECGSKQKMLRRHLSTSHGMTPEQYRAEWNLPVTYPMAAPNYAERRRELAKAIGLGRKPKDRPAKAAPAAAKPASKAAPRKRTKAAEPAQG